MWEAAQERVCGDMVELQSGRMDNNSGVALEDASVDRRKGPERRAVGTVRTLGEHQAEEGILLLGVE